VFDDVGQRAPLLARMAAKSRGWATIAHATIQIAASDNVLRRSVFHCKPRRKARRLGCRNLDTPISSGWACRDLPLELDERRLHASRLRFLLSKNSEPVCKVNRRRLAALSETETIEIEPVEISLARTKKELARENKTCT
jgi:hypothetical protein